MVRPLLLCATASLAWSLRVGAQIAPPQIEQARLFSQPPIAVEGVSSAGSSDFPDLTPAEVPDDAFGAQVIMKDQERPRPFTAFAEVAAFFTNNVGLVKNATEEDSFLVISAGIAYVRPLARDLRIEAGVRSSIYRYAEFRELDFQSVDASIGLVWSAPKLAGTELLLRYTYTDLTTAEHGYEFFKNHAVLLGAQNLYSISRAMAVYGGVSAQLSWADPQESGRDEYSAFAGFRVQATRCMEADFFYRYGRYVYREANGRHDNNQTISATLRYSPKGWVSASVTGFAGFNRSNRPQFDYDVANVGVALQATVRF